MMLYVRRQDKKKTNLATYFSGDLLSPVGTAFGDGGFLVHRLVERLHVAGPRLGRGQGCPLKGDHKKQCQLRHSTNATGTSESIH